VYAALISWGVALVGLLYVVAASFFLTSVVTRRGTDGGKVLGAWALAWLGCLATWVLLLGSTGSKGLEVDGVAIGVSIVYGSFCFGAWQLTAWALRSADAAVLRRSSTSR
jgi:hypothetical protein